MGSNKTNKIEPRGSKKAKPRKNKKKQIIIKKIK